MAPNNALTIHGNEKTMNLNSLLLTNIQSSPYFKVNLYGLKTYHEVIDEIYYKVSKGNTACLRRDVGIVCLLQQDVRNPGFFSVVVVYIFCVFTPLILPRT